MKNVAILAHSDIALFELGCATELFALPRPEFDSWYKASVVSFEQGPFQTLAGVSIQANHVENLDGFDTLVVPSWPTEVNRLTTLTEKAIHAFYNQGGQILTFCSGAFLLGQLGLLDGRRATTHWRYEKRFKSAFPKSRFQSNVLYVLDDQIGCSAGSAAAIDLGLAVIRQDFGAQKANSVAKRLVMSTHRKGGQSQFVETPVQRRPNQLGETLDWAASRLATDISINQLATRAHMSRRTFDRLFRKQMGVSPQEWLISQRIRLAQSLLEESSNNNALATIDHIADQSGFSSAGNLRHHFHKHLGVSPRQYRDNFCH